MRTSFAAFFALVVAGCGELDLAPLDAALLDDGAAPSAIDAAPFDAGPPPEDLEGFVDWHMRAGGIRGLAAAITTPDRTVLTLLRGEASEDVAVSADTLFVLASISKTFTGVLVVQLVEEGLLDLDAPLDQYLPYDVRHPAHPDVAVTARMLLTHTSGLEDDLLLLARTTTHGADSDITLSDFARDYVASASHWGARPGATYAYCNAGFAVLGALVEAISREGFRARSDARLLAPLGLAGAGWFLADVDVARIATPYTYSERRGFTAVAHGGWPYYPAASLRASITHMARYARAVSRGLELDGARVLSPELAAEMRRVPFPEVAGDRALSWEIETLRGRAYAHHSGATQGGATLLYVGDDGVSLIVLTNSDAYIRSRLGSRDGADALRAILLRLDTEADALARE